ncbi:MAG: preprotein translocase subunit SecG [Verrucomicrobiales bacterium]|nr:preprotein translocase subunit SecG [Verrucomicrobiales bacterium]
MSILITLLTTVLVLNCFFLVLLILIQLPKKESGSGLAFGGGALDMALGAGAGNVLTRFTKYSATLFLGLCLLLAVIGNNGNTGSALSEGLDDAKPAATEDPTGGTPPSPSGPTTSTETPAANPAPTEGSETTEATTEPPSTTETTPAPDADSAETTAQPGEGEEKK